MYRKSSIKPPGAYLFQTRGLLERGCLFNTQKKMVAVVYKELDYKVEKLKYNNLEVMQPRIKNKSELLVGE